MQNKKYNISFMDLLTAINDTPLNKIIESEDGNRYKLTEVDYECNRKYTRMKGTTLRFMTYDNLYKKFTFVEESNIHKIKEFNTEYTMSSAEFEMKDKINEIINVVNKLVEVQDEEYCQNCGDILTEENKYMDGMCMECKCGIDWKDK